MTVYRILEKYQKPRKSFESTDEFSYFIENRALLSGMKKFAFLNDNENDEFNVMRANIILRAYQNKETIEKEIAHIAEHYAKEQIENREFVSVLNERLVDLPYYKEGDYHIFVPFFPRSLNVIYSIQPEKLLNFPYSDLQNEFDGSTIDPFDTYGNELFNSNFTRLIKIGTNGRESAFFHYDTYTIYIVNAQGRLDSKIVLFDKYIRNPNYNHILERVEPVMKAYFDNNREKFIRELYNSKFISIKLVSIIRKKGRK